MLASAGEAPSGAQWAAEVKWDGWRAQLRWDGSKLCVRTRPGRDCTAEVPELASIGAALGNRPVLLDGELVCFGDDGRPDFAALGDRMRPGDRTRTRARPATFLAFDVLHLDGLAARTLPYSARRELLAELALDGPAWRTPEHYPGGVGELLTVTAEHELEGIVAKRLDSVWRPGARSSSWVKVKHRRSVIYTVTAWQPGDAGELDAYGISRTDDAGQLVPVGSVSFGLTGDERARLRARAAELELPARRRGRWRPLQPLVRVEVAHHGSPAGPLRDPVLRAVLDDATRKPR